MFSLTTGLLLGLVLGARHALEPDHLAAVSTLVTARGQRRSGVLLGAFWGIGHSLSLLIVGSVLASVHAELPHRLSEMFELLVAVMLLFLGARAILRSRSLGSAGPVTTHTHGKRTHTHVGDPRHVHLGRWTMARCPLLVGMVHGLAGSGALTALAMADMPTLVTRLLYILLFGVGSVVAMALLTGAVGWPLARFGRSVSFGRALSIATGTLSVLLGAFWGWTALLNLAQT
jgi:hypothetical protein